MEINQQAGSSPGNPSDMTNEQRSFSRLSLMGFSPGDDVDPLEDLVEIYLGTVISPSFYLISPLRSVRMMSPSCPGPVKDVLQIEWALNARTLLPLTSSPARSDLVAVEACKNDWRRGRVLKLLPERGELSVFLVDTGNVVVAKEDRLRVLPEDLSSPPFLARKFLISDIEPIDEKGVCNKWVLSATDMVQELVKSAEQSYMFVPNIETSPDDVIGGDIFLRLSEFVVDKTGRAMHNYQHLINGDSVISLTDMLMSAGYAAKFTTFISDDSSFYTPSTSLRLCGSSDVSEAGQEYTSCRASPTQLQEDELMELDNRNLDCVVESKKEIHVNCETHEADDKNESVLPSWLNPVLLTNTINPNSDLKKKTNVHPTSLSKHVRSTKQDNVSSKSLEKRPKCPLKEELVSEVGSTKQDNVSSKSLEKRPKCPLKEELVSEVGSTKQDNGSSKSLERKPKCPLKEELVSEVRPRKQDNVSSKSLERKSNCPLKEKLVSEEKKYSQNISESKVTVGRRVYLGPRPPLDMPTMAAVESVTPNVVKQIPSVLWKQTPYEIELSVSLNNCDDIASCGKYVLITYRSIKIQCLNQFSSISEPNNGDGSVVEACNIVDVPVIWLKHIIVPEKTSVRHCGRSVFIKLYKFERAGYKLQYPFVVSAEDSRPAKFAWLKPDLNDIPDESDVSKDSTDFQKRLQSAIDNIKELKEQDESHGLKDFNNAIPEEWNETVEDQSSHSDSIEDGYLFQPLEMNPDIL